ncbi:FixH family protein [Campylobacter sp. MIT 21-1685]|uniref:FixH family protein n=1 Tax=unclassified Campylobacter TaxID=2593542 RepID=UPI00224A8450|nr:MULTISPECIES: FixH family protein [unclassified Campylobacter]MCX2683573.1 FixH family protein [Campylobacter sp. MIT 21-1684]MCX2751832.1 FixH family protein [Campylobacter sp. MIT 21-1682]MCX2808057.1 FixH family protein [Campylobacter sp. MIT 21-1685]
MNKKKTFWPYGIVLSLFAIVLACIATIIFASHYPVYEDDFYFDSYQNVENSFNDIQKKQAEFDKLFRITFKNDKVQLQGKRQIKMYSIDSATNKVEFNIQALSSVEAEKLQGEFILTRPHTNAADRSLQGYISNGHLTLVLPKLEKGRWQLKLKLQAHNLAVGFFSYELNVL